MANRKNNNNINANSRRGNKAIRNSKSVRNTDSRQVIKLEDSRRERMQRNAAADDRTRSDSRKTRNSSSGNTETRTVRSNASGYTGTRAVKSNVRQPESRNVQNRTAGNNGTRYENKGYYGYSSSNDIGDNRYSSKRYTAAASEERTARKKQRKKRNRNGINVTVVTSIIFCMVLCYLVGYAYNFVTKEIVSYDTVQYGSIEAPKSATGVIIRKESVYTTPISGMVNYNVSDNEKVKNGIEICSVRDAALVETMEQNLDTINENILKLQESRGDISFYTEDVKKVNSQIKKTIDESAYSYVKLDISNVYDLKSSIQKKLDVRNQMLLSESKGSLSDLANEKLQQENELAQNTTRLNATEGGIVSYYIDNMEGVYTPETMSALTKEQTTMKPVQSDGAKSSVVSMDPVFKIVSDNNWYIAAYINNSYIDGWQLNDIRNIYVKDDVGGTSPLEVQIVQLDAMEKESYVVLKVTKYIMDYISQRTITFEVDSAQVGYKIPNNAIVEETLLKIPMDYVDNGVVYKVVGDTVSAINIINSGESSEENMIYAPVQLGVINVGDTLQKPGDKDSTTMLSEVMTTQGIYVMNTGIAEFNKINLEGSISNSTHTILNPANNTNINIYDRIVTDTINIEKEQKVYS